MSVERDAMLRTFLAEAEQRDGAFVDAVLARVAAQDAELGDSYLWTSLDALLREAAEEAEDLAAWGGLAAASLAHRPELTDGDRERLRALLVCVARLGAQAHPLLSDARRIVGRSPVRSGS